MWLHKEKDFANTLARLEQEGFAVKPFNIVGEECWLIFPPHMGVEWNEDNLIYRSSIWNSQGYPVSLSWKKFFNWDERCDIAPKPESLDGCELIDKIDGSTLLVSMYNGQMIMRTRGSTTLDQLDNGFEKTALLEKYNTFFSMFTQLATTDCTFVFEWVTPTNKIVLDYGDEPKLYLTGIINHKDYSYTPQNVLDQTAEMFSFERGATYTFDTIKELHNAMQELKGIEGVCVYFDNGQDIKKVKTKEYLMLHSVKFKLGYKALIEMIYEENVPLSEFKKIIVATYDYEAMTYIEHLIDEIYEADARMKADITGLYESLLFQIGGGDDRKKFAEAVFESDEGKCYSGFLFKMFEAEDPDIRQILMASKSILEKFKKMILELLK